MTRPTDKELLWREERDEYNNTTLEALSYTWGNAENQPTHLHTIQCVLRNNTAVWRAAAPEWAVYPPAADPANALPWIGRISASLYSEDLEEVKRACQDLENDLRAMLGEGLPPAPEAPSEDLPMVTDEMGFAPTTRVQAHWTKNHGRLYFTRTWAKPAEPNFPPQMREITDPDEERQCFRNYFRQQLIEEAVTRLVTGGFGRLLWETPFATALMQCELEMHTVSAMSVTIRRQGQPPEEIQIPAPTMEEFMNVVAAQMHARQAELIAKVGNKTELELHGEIARAARALGIAYDPPSAEQLGDNEPTVAPVELLDIHQAGGNLLKPGELPNGRRRGMTLIEVLVLISIFCIVLACMIGALRGSSSQQRKTEISGHTFVQIREPWESKWRDPIHDPECSKCKGQPIEGGAR